MSDPKISHELLCIVCEEKKASPKKSKCIIGKRKRRHLWNRRRLQRFKAAYKVFKCNNPIKKDKSTTAAMSVYDITNMYYPQAQQVNLHTTPAEVSSLPADVVDWQEQEKLAYWKSRVVSLELENRMLHQHIRNIYAKQIQDINYYVGNQSNVGTDHVEDFSSAPAQPPPAPVRVEANVPDVKKNMNELKNFYGRKWQRVMGMETAVQLNFDRCKEESSAAYWPNIPFKP